MSFTSFSFDPGVALPDRFTFPFYYDPHPLAELAASDLQRYIGETDLTHDFDSDNGLGKMFGVLVVKHKGELGYLSAFSGKLNGGNDYERFVPPVYDSLLIDGFLNKGMEKLAVINVRVKELKADAEFATAKKEFDQLKATQKQEEKDHVSQLKEAKRIRKQKRMEAEQLNETEKAELLNALATESVNQKFYSRELQQHWRECEEKAAAKVAVFTDELDQLKQSRKALSASLQQQLFDEYNFLNQAGEKRNVCDIFENHVLLRPPAGAGECAAPKLLQYAFENGMTPICMAEFWWGRSPKSEVRKHAQFYPACRGKCEPILGHMLGGMEVDENPLLTNPSLDKHLEILFEDAHVVAVNKPADFLSVPGKTISDSVYSRMVDRYPGVESPFIVHRLDMATSGVLLIAKSNRAHKALQKQFMDRTIKKRYIALLEGAVRGESGVIDLPLRLDIDDRPRQLVCREFGKTAQTSWKVLGRSKGKTRVHFFPITGRSHQLRVHAAHHEGLNTPIVGDDLYGNRGERLHLHAEWIQFDHPITGEQLTIQCNAEF